MTTAADDYPLPATMEGLRDRIAEVNGDIQLISAQLADRTRCEQMGDKKKYAAWRRDAKFAYAHRIRELAFLKAHLVRAEQERQAQGQAARAERQAAAEAERQRKAQAWLEMGDQDRLILDLYSSLCRIYRRAGVQPSEVDKRKLDAATAYLTEKGILTA